MPCSLYAISMKILVLIQLLFIPLCGNSQTLKKAYSRLNPEAKDVVIKNCKFDSTVFIVICQTVPGWKENIDVVQFKDGKIKWKADFDTQLPSYMTFTSIKQITINGIKNPIFEIFGEYLNAFGEYNLYELRGHTLHLIANTFAIDGNGGDDVVINGKHYDRSFELKAKYSDLNNDEISDIVLSGAMKLEPVYDSDSTFQKTIPARKVLLYKRNHKTFVEDKKYRKGFLRSES
jgi:hypothetical protein